LFSAALFFLIHGLERTARRIRRASGNPADDFALERAERRQPLELGGGEDLPAELRTDREPVLVKTATILLDHRAYEYQVVPDVSRRRATEIFEITEVKSANPQSGEVVQYEPFYSYRHGVNRSKTQAFWRASRRASGYGDDEGTDVFLSLVDLSSRPVRPNMDALTVRTICTNRDLPSRLPFGNEGGDFELEGAVPVKRIVALIAYRCAASASGQGFHVAAGIATLAQLSFAGGKRKGSDAGDPAALQLHGVYLFRETD
jgi:hypothetical protein